MISGLGTVLDRLQALFGKGYLLGGVLPFFILASAVLVVGDHVFASWRLAHLSLFLLPFSEQWPYELGFIVLVALLGFVFWALNSWFRQVLEGRRLFPEFLQQVMSSAHQGKLDTLDQRLNNLRPELAHFREVMSGVPEPRWIVELRNARQHGANASARDVPQILQEAYKRLQHERSGRSRIRFEELNQFALRLGHELESNRADAVPLLDRMHQEFISIARYALSKIETEYFNNLSERRARYPGGGVSLAATRMGIIAQIPSDYAVTRYGLDLEAFWLLIQRRIRSDDKFSPTVDDAKIQLDFAVGMTTAFAMATVFIFTANVYRGVSVALFIASFASALLMMRLFYEVSVQSYYGYTQAIKAAVDMYRFDVLKGLGVFYPTDSNGERQIWDRLTSRAVADNKENVFYHLKDD